MEAEKMQRQLDIANTKLEHAKQLLDLITHADYRGFRANLARHRSEYRESGMYDLIRRHAPRPMHHANFALCASQATWSPPQMAQRRSLQMSSPLEASAVPEGKKCTVVFVRVTLQ